MANRFFRISIPFWSDFNNKQINRDSISVTLISIPFWSDFNYGVSDIENVMEKTFQSHFGLILTFFSGEPMARVIPFQSHFGLILTP